MKKIDILHIYFGTAGLAGSYMHEIYLALEKKFSQKLIVNYYYDYKEGIKIGYPFTELAGKNYFKKNKMFRYFIRYIELSVALIYIFLFTLIRRPKVINYSLITNLKIEEYFLTFLKLINSDSKIMVTCHDAKPFEESYNKSEKRYSIRNNIFNVISHLIIVHNDYSKRVLMSDYNISEKKILRIPFPPMNCAFYNKNIYNNKNYDFAFIGHMRKEKGLDILLNSWEKFKNHDKSKNNNLLIAGNLLNNYQAICNKKKIKKLNITIVNNFLDDKLFVELLSRSKFLVLPYLAGSNSGFPHLAVSCNTIPIVSDLDFFKEISFISDEHYFRQKDVNDLTSKLLKAEAEPNSLNSYQHSFDKYKLNFIDEINSSFNKILKNM